MYNFTKDPSNLFGTKGFVVICSYKALSVPFGFWRTNFSRQFQENVIYVYKKWTPKDPNIRCPVQHHKINLKT
jgi:hypothetical protein